MPIKSNLENISIPLPEQVPLESKKEKVIEKTPEKAESKKNENIEALAPASSATPVSSSVVLGVDSETKRIQAIEAIMSNGLDKVFLQMSPKERKRFRSEGEKTALKINVLLKKAKFSADKIVTLIRRWLSLIPRINRFFLEQEAKIKADKIIKVKKDF